MSAADFCDKLEGFYDNWFQAAKDPARYAHIKLRWERIGDNLFKSKQWYHYIGEENPYRLKWHKVFEQQGVIIVQNWTPDWGEHTLNISKGDMTELKPNVTFHMIAVMQFGNWGVEASESIRVTDKGAELFYDFPKELRIKS